jgi:hypothetical protein
MPVTRRRPRRRRTIQFFLAVEALRLLAVHDVALQPQQHVQSPTVEAVALGCQLAHPCPDHVVI